MRSGADPGHTGHSRGHAPLNTSLAVAGAGGAGAGRRTGRGDGGGAAHFQANWKCAHGPTFSSLPQLALGALQSPEPAAKLGEQMEEEQRQLFKAAKTDAMKGAKPPTAALTASSLEGALLSLHELHHIDGTKAILPRHLLAACSGIEPQPFRHCSSL